MIFSCYRSVAPHYFLISLSGRVMGSREGASCNILDQQGGHMNNLVLIPLLVPMILAKYTVLYCTVLYYTVPMVLSKNSQVFDNCEDYFVSHKAS